MVIELRLKDGWKANAIARHQRGVRQAIPHNSRLTPYAPLRRSMDAIRVAKMLDNRQNIICAFCLAADTHRSSYRHVELCGVALKMGALIPWMGWVWKQNKGEQKTAEARPSAGVMIYYKTFAARVCTRRLRYRKIIKGGGTSVPPPCWLPQSDLNGRHPD